MVFVLGALTGECTFCSQTHVPSIGQSSVLLLPLASSSWSALFRHFKNQRILFVVLKI